MFQCKRGQNNTTMGKVHGMHADGPDSILGTQSSSLCLLNVILDHRARIKPVAPFGVPTYPRVTHHIGALEREIGFRQSSLYPFIH